MYSDKTAFDNMISAAYDKTDITILSESCLIGSDRRASINISSMLTLLVQDSGRYAERFASDVIISANSLTEAIKDPDECNGRIFLFGIRESGVDHYEFVREQMQNSANRISYFDNYYRKVYAIHTYITEDNEMQMSSFKIDMKEIRQNLGHELWAYMMSNNRR